MERDFKGVWIPKEIYLDTTLNWTEKILLIEIDSLDGKNGCFATNDHFAKHLMISKGRVSKLISKLNTLGYISIEFIHKKDSKEIEKRIIHSNIKPWLETTIGYSRERLGGVVENDHTPIVENDQENNTLFNNTINNTFNNNMSSNSTTYKEIIDYLNSKAKTNYKYTTKKTQSCINARLAEGFTVEDFKKVIDNKCKEWLNTEYSKFLRPETLFGNKFEGYLNQKPSNSSTNKKDSKFFNFESHDYDYDDLEKKLLGWEEE